MLKLSYENVVQQKICLREECSYEKISKATAVIMAAALAATGCSSGGAKTSDTQQPSGTEAAKTEAAGDAAKTEAAKDAASGEEEPVLVVYTARSEALNNAVIPEFERIRESRWRW